MIKDSSIDSRNAPSIRLSERAELSRIEFYRCLAQTLESLRRQVREILKPRAISEPQYEVLALLRDSGPRGLTCGEIVARMTSRDPDVTRLLDRLEKRGLILRARDTADRRVVSTQLTAEGAEVLAGIEGPLHELHKRQLEALGDGEAEKMIRQLQRVRG